MTLLYPRWPPPALCEFRQWCEDHATTFAERRSARAGSWDHKFWDLGFGCTPDAAARDTEWVGVSFATSAYVSPEQVGAVGGSPAAVVLHASEPHAHPEFGTSPVLRVALAALDVMGGLAELLEPGPATPDAPGRLLVADAGPDAYPPLRRSYFADAARVRWLAPYASASLFFEDEAR